MQHTLRVLNHGVDNDTDSDDEDDEANSVANDLLGKVRALIKAIRASGQRQADFLGVVASGNKAGWWKDSQDKVVELKALKFILDVRTRWDSTYQMLIRLRMFHQVNIFTF